MCGFVLVLSDCFKRISIGERLITYDVTRIVERNTVGGCETECNIYKCTHFSFGITPEGNGTCELTTDREISRRHDSDFDLYQRTEECAEGKPTGYEEACYRRIVTGKRLHERFIRHSLPCNSLEACQHQCSIEKHFSCQGFNIRLDPDRVGRGICELSSVAAAYFDPSKDFVYDPEFVYYERDRGSESPNCGHINGLPNVPPRNPEENTIRYQGGGPYYGGDSYGPWSTGHGTVDHGPWGSRGYGSGLYETNNPSRGPIPTFHPSTPDYYGGGGGGGGGGQPYPGQPGGSQPYPGQYAGGFPGQHAGGQAYPGQQIGGQPFPGQYAGGFPGGQSYPGQHVGGQPYSGQRAGGQPYPGAFPGVQPFPGSGGGQPYPAQPGGSGSYPGQHIGGQPYPSQHGGGPSYPVQPGGTLPYPGPSGGGQPYPSGLGGDQSHPVQSGGIQPYPERPGGGQPYPGRPGGGQSYPGGPGGGQSYPIQPGGGQPYPGRPGGGQSYPSQPGSGQSYPVQSGGGQSYPGVPVGGQSYPSQPGGGPSASGPSYSSQPPRGSPSYPVQPGGGGQLYPGPSGGGPPFPGQPSRGQSYPGPGGKVPPWGQSPPPSKFPTSDRRYGTPNRIPTYIIIDADAQKGGPGNPRNPVNGPGGPQSGLQPYRPDWNYLPSSLPIPRPIPPPPKSPLPSRPFYEPSRYFPPGTPDRFDGVSQNTVGREVCFQRAHPGYKLNPSSIRRMYHMPTVMDCEAMCTKSPFKCTGYSFRYASSSGGSPNCLLTDFSSLNRETNLLPDRSCDVYFKMGTCLDLDRIEDTECFLKVATSMKIDPAKIAKKMTVSGMSECELACLNSNFFACRSFTFRYGPGIIGEPIENCLLSDWPITALQHSDFVPVSGYDVYERGSYGHGCELDVGPPHIGPKPPSGGYPNVPQISNAKGSWSSDQTWKHFTVNGWPCRAGTECQLNPEAGFWGCEVEGGDRAQWDYCCRPKHSCGFSRGFNYPWCYVGEAGPEQWRPCSETYYPEFGNRFPYKPVKGHTSHPVDSHGPYRDTRPWNFGDEEFGPPSHWPISYLYAEPPPNETIIWDTEHHHYHHHHYHYYPERHPEHYQVEDITDDDPQIRFKPCGHKTPYPRAVIQKLDLKNIPKAGDPGEQVRNEEKNPRNSKKLESIEKVPDSEVIFGFSLNNRDKENVKNEVELITSVAPPYSFGNFTEDFPSHKRASERRPRTNGTAVESNKPKEVIKTVEEIIEQNSTEESSEGDLEKNETLKKIETKYPGFVTLSELEGSGFATGYLKH